METKAPMNELAPGKLARPMDRNAMSNDMGILKNLLGLLNNPAVTGAEVPTETDASIPAPSEAKPASHPTPPMNNAFKIPPGTSRIFLTGAAKSGKSWVAAQASARIMELMDPVDAMIADVFTGAHEESVTSLRNELFAWGCGVVSKGYPLTASRMMFVDRFRQASNQMGTFGVDLKTFGTANFWTDSLVARVAAFEEEFPGQLVIVTDVNTVDQYKALREAGFLAFHVLCNNITRSSRGVSNIVNPLVTSIERDITQKISQQPRGPKMWAIWSDEKYPPTSSRLLTVQEFVQGVTP